METLYWSFEFIKVAIAYICIMFIWPRVVFRKYLNTKNKKFRFAFCVTVQPILVNTVVIGLGLLNILSPLVLVIFFYGIFIISIFKKATVKKIVVVRMKNFFAGTYGTKSLVSDVFAYFGGKLINLKKLFLDFMAGNWFRYCILIVVLLFSAIYFSYGSFQSQSYSFGDYYVHHMWTYNLTQGNIFSSGIYPEGMHCFICCMYSLFGVNLLSCFVFLGGIQSTVIIISIYLLFRELFAWKYSAIIAVALFITLDVKCFNSAVSYSRLSWTMPQEFAFPALFLCSMYLIRYLRTEKNETKSRIPLFIRDENLFMFTTALAATLISHFYATMLAFFLCVGIIVPLIRRLFSKRFLPLIVACFASLFISCMPMGLAYASGIPLQGSLEWALEIMGIGGNEDEDIDIINTEDINGETNGTVKDEKNTAEQTDNDGITDGYSISNSNTVAANVGISQQLIPLLATGSGSSDNSGIFYIIKTKLNNLYKNGFKYIYGSDRAVVVVFLIIASAFLWLVLKIVILIKNKTSVYNPIDVTKYDGYLMISIATVIFAVLWAAESLGLTRIIEQYRLGIMTQFAIVSLVIVIVDIICVNLFKYFNSKYSGIVVSIMVLAVYFGTKLLGVFHGFLAIELTRYNSVVLVTQSIVDTMEKNSYTIVSTTDEYYQQIDKGYHEELISFVNQAEVVSYTLPSRYIFIYIEKNVLVHPQYHLFDGPSWLADEKYSDYFGSSSSRGDNLNSTSINEEMSQVYFGPFGYSSTIYNTHWKRIALMSKAYYWCQKFNEMYPNELHVYYEDDDFVCYYIEQNPRNLYELAVMDPDAMILPSEYPNPIWPENAYK